MFDILIWDNQASLSEIFYDMVKLARDSGANETRINYITENYERQEALFRIYTRMNELKYDKIDWERGIKDGIFSLMNYYQIPSLKEFRAQGNKDFLGNYPKEDYSKGEQVIKDLEEKYKD